MNEILELAQELADCNDGDVEMFQMIADGNYDLDANDQIETCKTRRRDFNKLIKLIKAQIK